MKDRKNLSILEERVPPHNLEAEMALLGAALLSEDARLAALEEVRPDFFYKKGNALVFEAIQELFEKNQSCDLVTLTELLNRRNILTEIGGQAYLAEMIDLVPSPANIPQYIRIVRDHHVRRCLIGKCSQIIHRSYQLSDDVEQLLDESEQSIFEVAEGKARRENLPIRQLVHDSFDKLTRLAQRKESLTGLPSGLEKLDAMTSGFQKSDLVIIAARPSMGKTALACSIARYLVIEKKVPAAIFSLEMSCEQLVQRMMCAEARVNLLNMRSGRLGQADWTKLTMAAGRLSEAPFFIDDTPAMSTMEIRARARRLVARENVGIIFVDYLQLIRNRGRFENRQQEISEISAALKSLAKELEVPVLALSQLSRAPEREKRKPQLSDLRESGAIEQDADLVMLLVREEIFGETEENAGLADIIVAKQRNGPTGDFQASFIKEYARFENLEEHHR